ncbi:MAG: hypothetical protein RL662_73 [Bacteroidota bacterium]|jgi:hypothetical protein
MKKILFLFFFLVSSFLSLNAQDKYQISGSVLDSSTKESILQAGVRILNAKDSSFVTGTVTNLEGKFSVSVVPGRYIVSISYIGYKEVFRNADARSNAIQLGGIALSDDGILLKEAVVTAKAAEIAVRGDTVEYNADSYKVQQSAMVEDLLKKMPGAEVSAEGKITINGKEIKKILVDGKEFFSSDPKVASKNLPAQMVDKLQVLDRKSDMAQMTGFDDGQEETVINLTVKKGMKQGVFGNATAGVGNQGRYGVNGMVNYMQNENQFTVLGRSNNTNNEGFTDNVGNSFRSMRPRGISFGGNNGITTASNGGFNFAVTASPNLKWGGNIRLGDTSNDVDTKNYTERYSSKDATLNQYTNENGFGNNKSTDLGADLRFEWNPDSLTKVIFSPTLKYGKNQNRQTSDQSTTLINPADTINWGKSNLFSEGNTNSADGKLEVSRRLGKQGRVLSFSLSGGFSNLDTDGFNYSETTYRKINGDSLSVLDRKYDQQNKGNNWSAFASYVEPVGNNNFVQLSYSYRKNYSESDRNTFFNDGTGVYSIVDTTATKHLENNFVNQAVELNFKSIRAKYNYTLGMAVQPSSSKSTTTTPTINSEVSNTVLNFAPVAQFNYMWSQRHNLRVNYNGSTNQPSVSQLSNVRDESDPNNIIYGNPNLKPTFVNRFRLRYTKFNPEQASAFLIFGGFSFTNNDIVSKVKTLSLGRRERTYENVNGNWNGDTRVIINRPLKNKKFSISTMTYGSYAVNKGFLEEDINTTKTLTFAENMGIQYRSDLVDFSLRGNVTYTNTSNDLSKLNDKSIYNYGGYFSNTWHLPKNITFDTEMTYIATSGMEAAYSQDQWVWNASIAKQIFKAKNGTLKLNVYDILDKRNNITTTSSPNESFSQSMTSSLQPYFMVSFMYKFQIFKGGAKMSDMSGSMPPEGGMGGRRPH